ncbi:MAG: hypothetical protein KKA65_03070 [Nanoarchaeota archaeon]|nr:hypothetical protein [Nanoarchaeota archaeon]MBU4351631.1 hypothetical protein [Nanoarchaeota archaeon]MBU4456459.1 hypothetical protein [Nanoarchaeota archaeon]
MAIKQHNKKEMRKHFIQTLYDTLDGVVSPTPYLEITEGEDVDVKFLNGKGRLPMPNTTEVTVLDIDIASMFFDDFHVLYEGVTGVGKTYTSDALFNAVFGPDGHYTLRLSGGILGSSALEPFTTTVLENGVPKTRIDQEKCQKYGALFIDEINRGDSQEVFQIVDGVINVNGDTGYLRIPIPGQDGRYKGLAILAAMNPADAEHSAALELDIAGENRFLKFRFPNGVAEAGSSQLEKNLAGDLHEIFWSEFGKRSDIQGGWRDVYPLVTDPEQLSTELDGQTREFIDTAIGYVGYDPKETFERNVELLQQAGVSPKFSVRDDNNYRKILDAQGKLKHSFVRRDLRKIRDLSRLLGFIKGVKDESYDTSVRLNDVAAGIGVILESKTITGTDYGSLIALVNDARSAYADMHSQSGIPEGHGLRQTVWQGAIKIGQEHGFKEYLNFLQHNMAQLNTQTTSAAQATMRSRVLADLAVLEHFSKAYEGDVTAALKEKGLKTVKAFGEIYQAKKNQSSIYEHRLGSILR